MVSATERRGDHVAYARRCGGVRGGGEGGKAPRARRVDERVGEVHAEEGLSERRRRSDSCFERERGRCAAPGAGHRQGLRRPGRVSWDGRGPWGGRAARVREGEDRVD